ncbi:MAG TPA: hypothetical protein VF275_10265 [Gammaproteobacteria bacterium]
MASENIDAVAEIALAANEQFTSAHPGAETSVGVISPTLRSMGVQADAVNIDCGHSGKRLVLILLDQNPDRVGIGIGQKETIGDYELIRQMRIEDLDMSDVLELLEARFIVNKP